MHTTIKDIFEKYKGRVNYLDLELLIANAIKKSREFVLTHPEYSLNNFQFSIFNFQIKRRINHEPLAYILGHKEFYGLDFKVNKNTLIPRPETELLVELTLKKIQNTKYQMPNTAIIDIGTGSGNIITSIAKAMENFQFPISNFQFFGVDTSKKALDIAKYNARKNKVNKKIKFLKGNLLEPFSKIQATNYKLQNTVILANLPYLSKKIYASASIDVKKYEPKSALFSKNDGLNHYEKLLKQIKKNRLSNPNSQISALLEISPEQKNKLQNITEKIFPEAKITFHKDLSRRNRVCELELR